MSTSRRTSSNRAPIPRPRATGLPETDRTGCPAALESEACRQREDDRGYEASETISKHFFFLVLVQGFPFLPFRSVGGRMRLK